MARHHGRCPRGQRCLSAIPHGHWQSSTFIAALRHESIEAPFLIEGPVDAEVFTAYLEQVLCPQLRAGDTLKGALENGLKDLDGFYTFVVGTRDGFAVIRDPVACKPAVIAETDDWVAMASEYRAIAPLPCAEQARIWEPAPATVYAWSRAA